jgi:hypothetical protein
MSFNISALIVDEVNNLVTPFGLLMGMPSFPCFVLAPKGGVWSSMMTEQDAFGRQSGLCVFQSLKCELCRLDESVWG